jgi:hypothetical protein
MLAKSPSFVRSAGKNARSLYSVLLGLPVAIACGAGEPTASPPPTGLDIGTEPASAGGASPSSGGGASAANGVAPNDALGAGGAPSGAPESAGGATGEGSGGAPLTQTETGGYVGFAGAGGGENTAGAGGNGGRGGRRGSGGGGATGGEQGSGGDSQSGGAPGADAGTGSCSNGVTDGDETDVDCGGAVCSPCNNGKKCKAATDCVSGNCAARTTGNICRTADN